jgi:endonuclease V-like protein UPF0215 family
MSTDYRYIDGVGSVHVVNGMAHMGFVVVTDGQQTQTTVVPVQHVVMPLPNFVRMCSEMAGHLQRMEQKGIIKRKDA